MNACFCAVFSVNLHVSHECTDPLQEYFVVFFPIFEAFDFDDGAESVLLFFFAPFGPESNFIFEFCAIPEAWFSDDE